MTCLGIVCIYAGVMFWDYSSALDRNDIKEHRSFTRQGDMGTLPPYPWQSCHRCVEPKLNARVGCQPINHRPHCQSFLLCVCDTAFIIMSWECHQLDTHQEPLLLLDDDDDVVVTSGLTWKGS